MKLLIALGLLFTPQSQANPAVLPACSAVDLRLGYVLSSPAEPQVQRQLFLAKMDCFYLSVENQMGGPNVLFFSNTAKFHEIMSQLKAKRLQLGSTLEDQITAKTLDEITSPTVLPPPPPRPQTFTIDQLRKGHMSLLRSF